MSSIPPWADGSFELIIHAEEHWRKGEDFDRRIALISFDNSIEVSISTYLSLHPIQRSNKIYKKDAVEKWLNNYHTKLEFLEEELQTRNLPWKIEKSHIIWAHEQRNEQYHAGSKGTPEKRTLIIIRDAALWVFSLLFDISNVEEILEGSMAATTREPSPQPDKEIDRAIDETYGMIEVAGKTYYTSEVLFNVDSHAYKEIGNNFNQNTLSKDNTEDF